MVRLADAAVPFWTYPHIDMKAAGAQAMRLLMQRIHAAPWARAFRQLDFWIPLGSQCTLTPPMQAVMAGADGARGTDGGRGTGVLLRFSLRRTFADCGVAMAAFADTQAKADAAADAFAAYVAAREALSLRRPCRRARQWPSEADCWRASRPVVLADTQDNPGGGGHGDTTEPLAELVRQGAKGALFA